MDDGFSGELAVNLLWCVPGAVGGSEEYLARQLIGLGEAAPDLADHLRIYALPGWSDAHPDLAARYRITTAPVDGRSRARRVLAESTWLASRTRGCRLVHHGGGTIPPRSPSARLLTIHDLQYLDHPRYFTAVKRIYLTVAVPRSVRKAAVIVVPSAFVRDTVVDAFGVTSERVVIVRHGVDVDGSRSTTPADTLRPRYALGQAPIVVYPAITHPHKNHRFLIDLMAGPWRERDVTLVLLGGVGAAEADVRAAIARAGLGERVVKPGRVSAADRDGLLAMAEALVFPSEYEGFGVPVLEAMAIGTPVVASDRAALPEVVGQAGLVLPLRLDAWADALDVVAARRECLVASGRERARVLTTAASGAALAAAYRAAMADG